MFLNLVKTRTIFGPVKSWRTQDRLWLGKWYKHTTLENLVHRPRSHISIRILSLGMFHKFVEIRACGHQRLPDVVFLLKYVLELGFKNSHIIEKQHLGFKKSWKNKKSYCCLPTQIREIWIGRPLVKLLHSSGLRSSVSCLAMQSIWQWTCSSWHLKRASHQVHTFTSGQNQEFLRQNNLIACGFPRKFLRSGKCYRPVQRLKRHSKSSSRNSKKNFCMGVQIFCGWCRKWKTFRPPWPTSPGPGR